MQLTIAATQQTFENPQIVQSLAVCGLRECRRMISCNGQSDFARSALDPATVKRENNLLTLRIVSSLSFHELNPFVTPPTLSVSCSLNVCWICIEFCHRIVFVCHSFSDC